MSYASRTNWKEAYEANKAELNNIRENTQNDIKSKRELAKEVQDTRQAMDALGAI